MKTQPIITVVLLAGLALAATSCTATTPGTNTSGGTADSSNSGTKPYPLATCLVTDNDLGSMGDEQHIVYQGREIKFCCKPCVGKFMKNPQKYLAKLGQ